MAKPIPEEKRVVDKIIHLLGENYLIYALMAFFALISFFIAPWTMVDPSKIGRQFLFFYLATTIIALKFIWPRNKPLALWSIYFALWLGTDQFIGISIYSYTMVLCAIFLYLVFEDLSPENKDLIAKTIVIIAIAQAIFALLYYFGWRMPALYRSIDEVGKVTWGFHPLAKEHLPFLAIYQVLPEYEIPMSWGVLHWKSAIGGLMGNSNRLGHYLALSLPFCFIAKWSRWAAIPIIIMLWFGNCVSAIIAGAAGMAYYAIKVPMLMPKVKSWLNLLTKKTYLVMSVVIIVLISLVVVYAMNIHGWHTSFRMPIWKLTLHESIHTPILGHGFDGFYRNFPRYLQEKTEARSFYLPFAHTHNEYLQVFYDYGLVGLILLGWIVIPKLRRKPQNQRELVYKSAMIALSVSAIAFFPMQFVNTALLGLFILASSDG